MDREIRGLVPDTFFHHHHPHHHHHCVTQRADNAVLAMTRGPQRSPGIPRSNWTEAGEVGPYGNMNTPPPPPYSVMEEVLTFCFT